MELDGDKDPFEDVDDIKPLDKESPILNTGAYSQDSNASHHGCCLQDQGREISERLLSGGGKAAVSLGFESPKKNLLESSIRTQCDLFETPKAPVFKKVSDSESEDDMFATVACSAQTSSGQAVPSGLVQLLDGPDPADLSWTSSMATPLTGNVTYSNLNTEERKVLLPSDCKQTVMPRALFSPDANDMVECRSLNLSFEVEENAEVKTKTMLGVHNMLEPLIVNPPAPGNAIPKSTSEKSSPSSLTSDTNEKMIRCESEKNNILDLFFSPVHKSKNRRVRRKRIRCSLVASPKEENDLKMQCQPQSRLNSPVLSGNQSDSTRLKTKLQERREKCATDMKNCSPLRNFSDINNLSLAESTPNASNRKPSLNSCSPNTEDFPNDISVASLEKVCQAQEQMVHVSIQIKETKTVTSPATKKQLKFISSSEEVEVASSCLQGEDKKNFANIENSQECDKAAIEKQCYLDDSFVEQLAEVDSSKLLDGQCNLSVKEKLVAIRKASATLNNFLYSTGQENTTHKKSTSTKLPPKVAVKEILKYASSLDSGTNIAPPKTLLKPTNDLIVFNALRNELDCVVKNDPKETFPQRNVYSSDLRIKNSSFSSMPNELQSPDSLITTAKLSCVNPGKGSICNPRNVSVKELGDYDKIKSAPECHTLKDVGIVQKNLCAPGMGSEDKVATLMKEETSTLSDTQMAQAADEVQLLLQLIDGEENFNSWPENECGALTEPTEDRCSSASKCKANAKETFDGKNVRGFLTAAGSTVSVSKEHLKKARELFESCGAEMLPVDSSVLANVEKDTEIPRENQEGLYLQSFFKGNGSVGFSTASGKAVKISQESYKKSHRLFQEDFSQCFAKDVTVEDSLSNLRASRSYSERSGHASADKKSLFYTNKRKNVSGDDVEEQDLSDRKRIRRQQGQYMEPGLPSQADGHAASSGESVAGPQAAPCNAKNSCGEISPINQNFEKQSQSDVPSAQENNNSERVNEASTEAQMIHSLEHTEQDFRGCLQVNEGKHTGETVALASLKHMKLPSISEGFMTAGGKPIQVTEGAFEKAKTLMEESSSIESSNRSKRQKIKEFATAAEKDDLLLEVAGKNREISFRDESTVFGDGLKFEEACADLSYNGPAICHLSDEQKPATNIEDKCMGFFTAGGNAVNISKEAFLKANNLFQEIPKDADYILNDKDWTEDKTNKSKSTIAKQSCSSGKDLSRVGAFLTASGNSVSISKKALYKAKQLLQQISDGANHAFSTEEITEDEKDKSSRAQAKESFQSSVCMQGFSTASGSSIPISKEALHKANNLFQKMSSDSGNVLKGKNGTEDEKDGFVRAQTFESSKYMQGFSTASGSSVCISEKALLKARNLFKEIPNEAGNPSNNDDFRDGREVVPKAKQGSSLEMMESVGKSVSGFSTAGGNSVHISHGALEEAKKHFAETPTELKEVDLKGFQNDKSLPKSKNHQESVCSSSRQLKAQNVMGDGSFSTASGSSITVSEESLRKARLMLLDDKTESCVEDSSIAVGMGKSDNLPNEEGILSVNAIQEMNLGYPARTSSAHLKGPVSKVAAPQTQMIMSRGKENEKTTGNCTRVTQEFSETTAALLADDEFFNDTVSLNALSSVMSSICTSPSMLTDRCSNLEPAIAKEQDDGEKCDEPSSPILMQSDKRGPRRRKGRLSLSSTPSPGPGASMSSLTNHKPNQLSEMKTVPSPQSCNVSGFVGQPLEQKSQFGSTNIPVQRPETKPIGQTPLCNKTSTSVKSFQTNGMSGPGLHPSVSNGPAHESTAKKINLPSETSSVSTPTHASFRVPYKTASSTPRCLPNSKLQPQKRRASYTSSVENNNIEKKQRLSEGSSVVNIYSTCPVWSPSEVASGNSKTLRPEVAALRHRAAEEQRRYIDSDGAMKGLRLRPCTGSLLACKSIASSQRLTWRELVDSTVPKFYPKNQLEQLGVRSNIYHITAQNAVEFQFSAWDFYSVDLCRENVSGIPVGDGALLVLDDNGEAGVKEVEQAFLASPGVDPSLVPAGWIQNHYRWIVWKLACMELRFPHHFGGRCLTPHILLQQLKYRYDREIDRCQRPALRRILEHDDTAAKRMVLCVASILKSKDESKVGSGFELELTDGWYSVISSIDAEMEHRVARGLVTVGTKLMIQGAELLNCKEGCSPLEIRADVRLQISTNSTRRARWYAKLGFQSNAGPLNITLDSVLGSGGLIGHVCAFVARVYPIVFMEKLDDGKTVVRSQRAEAKEASFRERRRQDMVEHAYSKALVEAQHSKERQCAGRQRFTKLTHSQLAKLTTGEELCDLIEGTSDPLAIQSMLSAEQQALVAECHRAKQENMQRDIEEKIREQLCSVKNIDHHATPILKLRLYDVCNGSETCTAVLSIWRPSEELTCMFREGQRLSLFGAVASGFRCGDLQLSSNRSTRYDVHHASNVPQDILRTVSTASMLSEPGWMPKFGELDVVGVVLRVGPLPNTAGNNTYFQNVYLADAEHAVMAISFWGGLKEFGVEDVLSPRTLISACNLQWRGGPVMRLIPCVYASEFSTFTSNPRQPHLEDAVKTFRQAVSDGIDGLVQVCNEKLEVALNQKVQPTPPRTPSSSVIGINRSEISKSVIGSKQLNSPVQCSPASNKKSLHSVGFSTPHNPPNIIQRKLELDNLAPLKTTPTYSPAVQRRLGLLDIYGDPPPLPPIVMNQPKRSLCSEFRVPIKVDSVQLKNPVSSVSKQDNPSMSQHNDR